MKRSSKNFCKVHRKTPLLESLFPSICRPERDSGTDVFSNSCFSVTAISVTAASAVTAPSRFRENSWDKSHREIVFKDYFKERYIFLSWFQ